MSLGGSMSEYIDRLVRMANEICSRDERLRDLVDEYGTCLVEPRTQTHSVDLSTYPIAQEHRFERDRPYIIDRVFHETGCDVSDRLTYPVYVGARARGRYLVTHPHEGVVGCRVNILAVPKAEIVTNNQWAFGVAVCGEMNPMRKATWVVRIVREPMNDLWTGFSMVDLYLFVHTLVTSDEMPALEGHFTIADAFRSRSDRGSQLGLKVATTELRRCLFLNLFPDTELSNIPYGMVIDADAIMAYKDLVFRDLERMIGPSNHRVESEHRHTVTTEVTVAQCVGIHVLPHMLSQILEDP